MLRLLLSLALVNAACAADIGESEQPDLEEAELLAFNLLAFNALAFNALSANFRASQAMVDNPLDSRSYDGSVSDLKNQLSDDLTQEFMKYVVGCALKPGQIVEYEDVVLGGLYDNKWEGQVGLCPDWHYGPADQNCQELVSACLLARNNAFGVSVELSMRGHDASGSRMPLGPTEATDFSWREGGFYGDIFEPGALADGVDIFVDDNGEVHGRKDLKIPGAIYKKMFACVSSVWTVPDAWGKDRICAGGNTNCAAVNTGACRFHQLYSPTYRCGYHDDPSTGLGERDYQVCKDGVGSVWKNAITVFLDDPCALYPKDLKNRCEVTLRNQKYGPNAWDAYDAKGGKL